MSKVSSHRHSSLRSWSEEQPIQDSRQCSGCHIVLSNGHRHRLPDYIQASDGCWMLYRELVARHQNLYSRPRYYRLMVDTYAVQHLRGGLHSHCKMAAIHLISLFLVLEKGYGPNAAVVAMQKVVNLGGDIELLALPPGFNKDTPTVLDIRGARTTLAHERAVNQWAESVWENWRDYHELIREWVGA